MDKQGRRVVCTCGRFLSKHHLKQHKRSNNHRNRIAEIISLLEKLSNQDVAEYIVRFLER
jgi:hypothetical protein